MILSRALTNYHTTQLRQSPATGVFLTVGWVTAILLTFIPGQLIATNRAELTALFTYLPWVMAVLIPTLAMPAASEARRGVTERLATLPHTHAQRLFSRFTVLWMLLGIWLLGFTPLIATLYYLGSPDLGPIATGLLGSWLLAAPMLAISLILCLRAKSGVGGLLASLAATFTLLLLGTNTVTSWFAAVPGLGWLPSTAHLTLLGTYQPFTEGLLNLTAILLLTGFTLAILGASLKRRALGTTIAGAVLILIAMLPGLAWLQLDTTSESLHTPSPQTIAALKQLPSPVTFTLHLSQNNPDVPAAVHQTATSLTNLLLRLRAAAPNKINVRLSNVDSSLSAAISALQAGAEEQSLPTGTTYFAALTATIASRTTVIPVLNPARQPVQEYDLMALLASAQTTSQPTLAILSGGSRTLSPVMIEDIRKSFLVRYVTDTADLPTILATAAALFLPDDAPLNPAATNAIRQYLGKGGNVILLTDSFSRNAEPIKTMPEDHPLSTLLPEWGITFVSNTLIADPTQGTLTTQAGAGATTYPYWLTLNARNLNTTLPFTTGINQIFLPEAGELLLEPLNPMTLTPLITSSPQSRAVSLTIFQSTPAELATASLPSATAPHILAAMASGAFTPQATSSGNLVVFADSDWLSPAALTQSPGNLTLLTNMLHYLSGQSTLTTLRAKGATPRTLTRIEAMANRLQQQTAQTEEQIATELYQVTQNPSSTQNAEERAFTLRQNLRDIRQQTRHRLQTLENALLLLNLTFMPTLTATLFFLQRRRQRLRATSTL